MLLLDLLACLLAGVVGRMKVRVTQPRLLARVRREPCFGRRKNKWTLCVQRRRVVVMGKSVVNAVDPCASDLTLLAFCRCRRRCRRCPLLPHTIVIDAAALDDDEEEEERMR